MVSIDQSHKTWFEYGNRAGQIFATAVGESPVNVRKGRLINPVADGWLSLPADVTEIHGAGIHRNHRRQTHPAEFADMGEALLHCGAWTAARQRRIEQQSRVLLKDLRESVLVGRTVVMP